MIYYQVLIEFERFYVPKVFYRHDHDPLYSLSKK